MNVFFRNFEIIKRIAYEVSLGLAYMNKRDIVHRSLSLENILLDAAVFLAYVIQKNHHPVFLCFTIDEYCKTVYKAGRTYLYDQAL